MTRERDGERPCDADFGYPAWRGFVEWAATRDDFRRDFVAETGIPYPDTPRTPLDAMIDQATGATEKGVEAFVIWVSRRWGLEYCPPAVREAASRSTPQEER